MPPPPATPSELITALDALKVQEEHPQGYRGGTFGYWRDDDHDGCNTRAEVLIAESLEPVKRANTCSIIEGRWFSAYDDQTFTQPRDMSIDHVVTIFEAWKSGAWEWTDQQRNDYLNDLNYADALIAVSNQSKDAKGDFDPRRWLPPNTTYRCDYLTVWVHLKTIYKLSVDPGEREAIAA